MFDVRTEQDPFLVRHWGWMLALMVAACLGVLVVESADAKLTLLSLGAGAFLAWYGASLWCLARRRGEVNPGLMSPPR